jgi:hypothetical protein
VERIEEKVISKLSRLVLKDETGKIGYLLAWLLGVPASLLFIIFLIRGD